MLSIGGSEWVIIVLLFLILIVGSKHLPSLGRSIGRAVGEYERARAGIRRELERIDTSSNAGIGGISMPIKGPVESEREKLEIVARTLGVDPKGMSDDELRRIVHERLGSIR
ncbi:MAG: twin-arginine translocase TatA/TatE family subunit [Candidatus Nitrosocaldus sp.]|nr:twin-arginine translocase TatA/TatE family subunit [Candidatus Nitrosocaldus sp.]MDW8275069.1 twin-arginine translocase TatA/TatE family subunit [Candidatus Nitrosocaldus sp.]